jgi:hypothetical protein
MIAQLEFQGRFVQGAHLVVSVADDRLGLKGIVVDLDSRVVVVSVHEASRGEVGNRVVGIDHSKNGHFFLVDDVDELLIAYSRLSEGVKEEVGLSLRISEED